jgi:prophage DNA circulation protein
MSTTKYLQASFRDAPFLVESNSDEQGPRNVIHEFPGREDAYAEPSGKFPARFSIEAHLIGDNFEQQLQALEAALDQAGPGKLLHPHRGTKFCAVDGPYRVQRNTRELGMVRLSITFCEAGPAQEPRVVPDTGSDVHAKAVTVLGKVRDKTATGLNLTGPDFLTAAVTSALSGPRGVVGALSKVNNKINAAFGLVDQVSRTILAFGNDIGTLVRTPDTLALHLQNLFNAVLSAATAASGNLSRGDEQRNRARVAGVVSYASALGTFGDSLPTVPTTTSTRQQQADNQAVLVDLIETAAVAETVSVLVDIPLDNTDQAGDAFAVLRDLFDRILDRGTLDDASTQALRDLRASFHRHLRNTVAELPELGHYTPPVNVPAVVLAYRLYRDSSRDQEIIERNPSIEHPGFITGGVELAVAEV